MQLFAKFKKILRRGFRALNPLRSWKTRICYMKIKEMLR